MIGPTLLLGALFPLVVRIISTSATARTSGRTVGEAYAANTIGAIAGSFASGFVLIPVLGLLGSLRLCAALNFVVAVTFPANVPSPEQYAHGQARRRGSQGYSATAPSSHVIWKIFLLGTISQLAGRWKTSATRSMIRT